MCWTGVIENKKIASHDVKCRKIIKIDTINGYYVPYYIPHSIKYEIGKTYKENIHPQLAYSTEGDVAIEAALHAYSMDVNITWWSTKREGLKATLLKSPLRPIFLNEFEYEPLVVECIIPKGTTYYENEMGEIASEALKIVRIINQEEICAGTEE